MHYKLHAWDYDVHPEDPGWPRCYVTYDHHTTDCRACHRPNGLLRVLRNLFGGPAARCRHRRSGNSNSGWGGGGVKGFARRKGCKEPRHYALAFRPHAGASKLPRRVRPDEWYPGVPGYPVPGRKGFRTRLPGKCKRETGSRNDRHHRHGHGHRHHDRGRGLPDYAQGGGRGGGGGDGGRGARLAMEALDGVGRDGWPRRRNGGWDDGDGCHHDDYDGGGGGGGGENDRYRGYGTTYVQPFVEDAATSSSSASSTSSSAGSDGRRGGLEGGDGEPGVVDAQQV